jgi:hypothetical protein
MQAVDEVFVGPRSVATAAVTPELDVRAVWELDDGRAGDQPLDAAEVAGGETITFHGSGLAGQCRGAVVLSRSCNGWPGKLRRHRLGGNHYIWTIVDGGSSRPNEVVRSQRLRARYECRLWRLWVHCACC